jgi:hypothetical protein
MARKRYHQNTKRHQKAPKGTALLWAAPKGKTKDTALLWAVPEKNDRYLLSLMGD